MYSNMTVFILWALYSVTPVGRWDAMAQESQTVYSHTSANTAHVVDANSAKEAASVQDVSLETIPGGTTVTEHSDAYLRDTQETPTIPVDDMGEQYNSIAGDGRHATMAPLWVTTVTPIGVTPREAVQSTCDLPLCEQDKGHYILNASACSKNTRITIDSSSLSSVEVFSDPPELDHPVPGCQWEIVVPYNTFIGVTVDQMHSTFNGKFTLTIWQSFSMSRGSNYLADIGHIVLDENTRFNSSQFLYTSWHQYLRYTPTLKLNFHYNGLYTERPLIFRYIVQEGPYIQNLPVTHMTDSMGYVTLPSFDWIGANQQEYDGSFELNIFDNDSVLISFTKLFLPLATGNYCPFRYVQVTNVVDETNQTVCGNEKDLLRHLYVFRSSIHLHFHNSGFLGANDLKLKMLFAVVPRAEEPQLSADNLVNCSVPHFQSFEPLLACNMLTECLGGEDERDCPYHSPECGPDAIDAGNKCLKTARLSEGAAWYDTRHNCSLEGTSLPTFKTKNEFELFKSVIDSMRDVHEVYIGAHLVNRWQAPHVSHLYKYIWEWTDHTTAFSLQINEKSRPDCCVYNAVKQILEHVECDEKRNVVLVCEFEKPNAYAQKEIEVHKEVNNPVTGSNDVVWNVSVVHCPAEHVTRDFLSCDAQANCNAAKSDMSCRTGGMTVPMFVCQPSRLQLHYTLVCDHMQHCPDGSDESFCQHPPCPLPFVKCPSEQCIHDSQRCDEKLDCYDGKDEASCSPHHPYTDGNPFFPPGTIYLNGKGSFVFSSSGCSASHFACPIGFCLPVYLRCNGVDDCPGREDEADCASYTCPGLYRCHGSPVCLHASNVCDGVPQCPRHDDELLCDPVCPEGCLCTGLAFVCTVKLPTVSFSEVRYLDASDSGMTLTDVNGSLYLVHLRLLYCGITSVPLNINLPNLRDLDLSWNLLTHLDMQLFKLMGNLRVLLLARNPLTHLSQSHVSGPVELTRIDLSYTNLEVYNSSMFLNSRDTVSLNMSGSMLTTILENGFQSTPHLKSIDLSGCHLNIYPTDLLRNLTDLQTVLVDDYKLCCPAMLPVDFNPQNCHAPPNLLASCTDLLRSNLYRGCLWLFASLSTAGNVGSLAARMYQHNQGDALGSFGVIVINLSVADFFMGVYLTIVGTADRIYQGRYLWYDDEWKNSAACKIAGFLSLLSSEVGAMMICLITLDRFLVLRFPFSRLHFGRWSALVACGLVWVAGVVLATVPLLPMTSHWEFYSRTSICIPLPFTSAERLEGYDYSFSIMILLNLVLFLLIAVGQAAIYWSIRAKSVPSSVKTSTRDAAIARRLTTVVVSDFLCWFPVGLLGLLAATGTPIPGELNVAVAIFVLPFNSALNPFLYTFNVITEKRRKAQEMRLRKRLESCVRMELTERRYRTVSPQTTI